MTLVLKLLIPLNMIQHLEVFSSSLIRKNIQAGNFGKVNTWLGRKWSMSGTVILGDKRAGKINFPTANLIPPSDLIHPKKGVYAVKIKNGNNYTMEWQILVIDQRLMALNYY